MTKVVVEIELDNESYDRMHGPGSEHWKKYHSLVTWDEHGNETSREPAPSSEYKSLEGFELENTLHEVLHEGFHDWASEGWMKVTIDGKACCEGCGRVEGRPHQSWCEKIAGPEASDPYLATDTDLDK